MTDLGKAGGKVSRLPPPTCQAPLESGAPRLLEGLQPSVSVSLFQMNRRTRAWRPRARWSQFREALPLYVILICDYKVPSAQTFPTLS